MPGAACLSIRVELTGLADLPCCLVAGAVHVGMREEAFGRPQIFIIYPKLEITLLKFITSWETKQPGVRTK